MRREEALELIKSRVKNQNIIRHMLAVGAIMKALARFLGEDEDLWELTGLLHDIDYEETVNNFERHGLLAHEFLKDRVPEEIVKAIKAHNYEYSGVMPETTLEKALIASDAVSGLLIACALVMPSKKLKDVRVDSVNKKFKDKDFARGADRKRITQCEDLGIPLQRFFEISLEALQSAQDLGV